jgi:hypothetical protein
MFYHAALLFAYEDFRNEANELADSVEKGNLFPLNERVVDIINNNQDKDFLKTYGFGRNLKDIQPIVKSENFPYINCIRSVR